MTETARNTAPLNDEQRSLVESHVGLAHRLASRWPAARRQALEREDLVQVGLLGLIEAARRFDPERGTFAAFARRWIRGFIQETLRSADPLTREQRRGVRQLREARDDLRVRHGREPSSLELATRLGWSPSQLRRHQEDDAALRAGLASTLEAASEPVDVDRSPEGPLLESEFASRLAQALQRLPSRQQAVLDLYYTRRLTMKEVGGVLRVGESRVSQLHSEAISRLRRALGATLPELGRSAAMAAHSLAS